MSKATRMLVILFNGRTTVHEAARAEICRTLGELCEATSVEMMELNARDLAIVAAKPIAEQLQVEERKTESATKTAEDEAIIYIGTVMAEELSKPKFDPIDFIEVLLSKARDSKKGADNRALLNAMFILSQDQLHVSESLMKKYNMTPYKIKLVKSCYNIICKA